MEKQSFRIVLSDLPETPLFNKICTPGNKVKLRYFLSMCIFAIFELLLTEFLLYGKRQNAHALNEVAIKKVTSILSM